MDNLRGFVLGCTDWCTATPSGKSEGGWDSIHVFEATDRARTSHYKLTSTVILRLSTASEALGDMDLSGNMTRQIEQDMPVQDDTSHIVNVGKLVEDMELKMRNLLRMFGTVVPVVLTDVFQRRSISAKRRMSWVTSEVFSPLYFPTVRNANTAAGIPPLTEANREKATHLEVISSMKR